MDAALLQGKRIRGHCLPDQDILVTSIKLANRTCESDHSILYGGVLATNFKWKMRSGKAARMSGGVGNKQPVTLHLSLILGSTHPFTRNITHHKVSPLDSSNLHVF